MMKKYVVYLVTALLVFTGSAFAQTAQPPSDVKGEKPVAKEGKGSTKKAKTKKKTSKKKSATGAAPSRGGTPTAADPVKK